MLKKRVGFHYFVNQSAISAISSRILAFTAWSNDMNGWQNIICLKTSNDGAKSNGVSET